MTLIVNLAIHEKAKLSLDEFLDRVQPVQAIRSNKPHEDLTLYIRSLNQFMLLHDYHAAIGQGIFGGLDGRYHCYHAAIEVSEPLYLWFNNTPIDTIMRQIICWLAAMHKFGLLPRAIKNEPLYKPVLDDVMQVVDQFFSRESSPNSLDDCRTTYHAAALAYYGSIPPRLLWEPAWLDVPDSSEPIKWGACNDFDLSIRRLYFTRRDWDSILTNGEEDTLIRADSSPEYWRKIKHQLVVGAANKQQIYSLFSSTAEKGRVYLIRAAETGHYKIGYTSGDPIQRLTKLQTGNPHRLTIVGDFPCAGKFTEKLLHDFFAKSRLSGEWFNLTDEEAQQLLDQNWRSAKSIF